MHEVRTAGVKAAERVFSRDPARWDPDAHWRDGLSKDRRIHSLDQAGGGYQRVCACACTLSDLYFKSGNDVPPAYDGPMFVNVSCSRLRRGQCGS